ncbi:MAG TPA: hypothetical protein VGR47_20235 [Terracidiphilus sp.]|nr:hypothetical protein [Terracidiphilus sp.]
MSPSESSSAATLWSRPPGILGDIADFIYEQAPYPFIESAIAGAIAYLAGIVGRAYNVNGMGLNHYVVLIAPTGTGKDAARTGIDKLNAALHWQLYRLATIRKGPGFPASAQGLHKALAGNGKVPPRLCCLSVFGEIGYDFRRICDSKANINDRGIRKMILSLYTSSGANKALGDLAYSNAEDNVSELIAPAWSFIGDSTPKVFYEAVDEESIADGFLTRLSIVEFNGNKPDKNTAPDLSAVQPSVALTEWLAHLVQHVQTIETAADSTKQYNWINVPFDDAAQSLNEEIEQVQSYNVDKFNKGYEQYLSELWTRFREKVMRTAALLAVGVNPGNPIITPVEYEWAERFVRHGHSALIARFRSGKTGEPNYNLEQYALLKDLLTKYYNDVANKPWTPELEKKYGLTADMCKYGVPLVTYRYILPQLHKRAAFKNVHIGPSLALKNTIEEFVKAGDLISLANGKSSDNVHDPAIAEIRKTKTGDMWWIRSTILEKSNVG